MTPVQSTTAFSLARDSLLKGLRSTVEGGVLWMNGDVVFDPRVALRVAGDPGPRERRAHLREPFQQRQGAVELTGRGVGVTRRDEHVVHAFQAAGASSSTSLKLETLAVARCCLFTAFLNVGLPGAVK